MRWAFLLVALLYPGLAGAADIAIDLGHTLLELGVISAARMN
jgi:hypothetical protein